MTVQRFIRTYLLPVVTRYLPPPTSCLPGTVLGPPHPLRSVTGTEEASCLGRKVMSGLVRGVGRLGSGCGSCVVV